MPDRGADERVTAALERLEARGAWTVDPETGREGVADLVVEGGLIASLTWHESSASAGPLLLLPGLTDLHVHLREPGEEDAETIESGLTAAAAGGFTAVCTMPNTDPPADSAGALHRLAAAVRRCGSPVRVLPIGAATMGRAGGALSPMAELAAAGAVAFSDDGSPLGDPALLRHALAYAAGFGLPVVEHAELLPLTSGAEMHEGTVSAALGLRGWPVAAEEGAVAGAIAVLRQVVADLPAERGPRLHLTHLSCGASVELVRRARAEGLPVTCDVTPHHLALHDGWVAGDRRYAWEAARRPWSGDPGECPPFDPNTRVNPPLRTPEDSLALARGVADGTVDAIATDHAPHRALDKDVPYGEAANGISGLETALPVLLAAVDAGVLALPDVVRALTAGPEAVLRGSRPKAPRAGLRPGMPAELVLIDRTATWTVEAGTLRSRGSNTPLLGRSLRGRVILTVAGGCVAHRGDPLPPDITLEAAGDRLG